jgi:hypothetical protein
MLRPSDVHWRCRLQAKSKRLLFKSKKHMQLDKKRFCQGYIFSPPKSCSKKEHFLLPFASLCPIVYFSLVHSYPVQPWPLLKIETMEGKVICFLKFGSISKALLYSAEIFGLVPLYFCVLFLLNQVDFVLCQVGSFLTVSLAHATVHCLDVSGNIPCMHTSAF